ncbi:MAG: hypothetical protein R3C49_08720 [Planctomycetaceae bacterium]
MAEFERLTDLPLVDRLRKANYMARELSEHLRQAYLPRLSDLRSAAKNHDPNAVSDQQILDRTLAVLEAEDFADELHARLRECLESIRSEMQVMLFGNQPTIIQPTQPVFDPDSLIDD